jgi:hypothetical protein
MGTAIVDAQIERITAISTHYMGDAWECQIPAKGICTSPAFPFTFKIRRTDGIECPVKVGTTKLLLELGQKKKDSKRDDLFGYWINVIDYNVQGSVTATDFDRASSLLMDQIPAPEPVSQPAPQQTSQDVYSPELDEWQHIENNDPNGVVEVNQPDGMGIDMKLNIPESVDEYINGFDVFPDPRGFADFDINKQKIYVMQTAIDKAKDYIVHLEGMDISITWDDDTRQQELARWTEIFAKLIWGQHK